MSENQGRRDGVVKWLTRSSRMLDVCFSRRSRNRSFLMNCGLWGKVSLCPNRRLYSSWLLTLLTMVCYGWREDYSYHTCPLTRSIPFFSRNVIWQFYLYDFNMRWWNMLVYRRWSLPWGSVIGSSASGVLPNVWRRRVPLVSGKMLLPVLSRWRPCLPRELILQYLLQWLDWITLDHSIAATCLARSSGFCYSHVAWFGLYILSLWNLYPLRKQF